jgi:hypothetical protein
MSAGDSVIRLTLDIVTVDQSHLSVNDHKLGMESTQQHPMEILLSARYIEEINSL